MAGGSAMNAGLRRRALPAAVPARASARTSRTLRRELRSPSRLMADAERKRLERNLHDGAQQRLVSLALLLQLAEGQLAARTWSTASRASSTSRSGALTATPKKS